MVDRRITGVAVFRDRAVRRQPGGAAELTAGVQGSRVTGVARRGKYLWLSLADSPAEALVAHLGMSGQFRVARTADLPTTPSYRGQERVRLVLDDGSSVSFVDQRTFGWLLADPLVPDGAAAASATVAVIPASVAHVAPDPFEPAYEPARAARRLRQRRTGLKRALLDQTLVSGIGNIYADEALWAARLHPDRATDTLSQRAAVAVLGAAADVMAAALASGGRVSTRSTSTSTASPAGSGAIWPSTAAPVCPAADARPPSCGSRSPTAPATAAPDASGGPRRGIVAASDHEGSRRRALTRRLSAGTLEQHIA